MTTRFIDPSPDPLPANGGAPARRAVVHWAWRLFRREWHQQLLILALVVIAVAAAFIGAAVATNTPAPSNAGFGTAEDAATFSGPTSNVSTQIASLQRRFGRVDVIENTTLTIRGSINTYDLRAQNPHGAFGLPMLALVAGLYPETRNEVAVTRGVASDFGLDIGASWREAGRTRQVVGIVENPQDFLDEFALVVPGQVTAPTEVTVLFDAPGVDPSAIGPNVTTPASLATSSSLNPETISLAVLTIGMILIALVAVGGFTVLAQRRLRSLGMLSSIGAADEHVSLVVRANSNGAPSTSSGYLHSRGPSSAWASCLRSSPRTSPHRDRPARSRRCRSSPPSRAARLLRSKSTARSFRGSRSSSWRSWFSAFRAAQVQAAARRRWSWWWESSRSSPA
jgi:putative ABC transport system permease protein